MLNKNDTFSLDKVPVNWDRLGMVMHRGQKGDFDCNVTGDPCIVWDPEKSCYHMFYFAQFKENGIEHNRNGHATVDSPVLENIKNWKKLGEVEYTNYEAMLGKDTHKPWILMDPYRPNVAAKWKGKYWLFSATFANGRKFVQAASSDTLDGPWTIDPSLNIEPGDVGGPDGMHIDAATAYYFEEYGKILVFFMAYPRKAQEDTPWTPYGSRSMTAEIDIATGKVEKIGTALYPERDKWTNGYIGGLQLLKASRGGWFALINASPTPPCSVEEDDDVREPAPSFGGFAYTPEKYPAKGWVAFDKPLEYEVDIPAEARANGEGVNMWRHHILVLPEGKLVCLYNTGNYGNEQMFGKITEYS